MPSFLPVSLASPSLGERSFKENSAEAVLLFIMAS